MKLKYSFNFHHRFSSQYSVKEDIKIIKYIIDHRAYGLVGGVTLWQDMVNNCLPGKFLKTIMLL